MRVLSSYTAQVNEKIQTKPLRGIRLGIQHRIPRIHSASRRSGHVGLQQSCPGMASRGRRVSLGGSRGASGKDVWALRRDTVP